MLNLNFIKNIKNKIFPFYGSRDLKFVFKRLQDDNPHQNKTAMFVGGCVRKYLSNKEIDDIDIATSLKVDQIKEKFQGTKFSIVDSGLKHGSLTLVSENLKLEITTLRKDVKTDGRHAEIEYTDSWEEDSSRRDFTINAIYLDINGNIFDPQLGINDLKNNNVKFIGDPQKRIEEDYLRILRFIRFSLEYESKIEKTTIEAIKLNLDGIKNISKERILNELIKIIKLKNFIKINKNEFLKEIFALIFPEFKFIERLSRLEEIPSKALFDTKTLLAILLIDEKLSHEYFLHKHNISKDIKDNLNKLAKNFYNIKGNKKFLQNDLKKNIYYFGKSHLKILNTINFASKEKIKLEEYLKVSNNIDNALIPKFPFDGYYLKKKGITDGMKIGRILKLLEKKWLDNDFKISNQESSKIIVSN